MRLLPSGAGATKVGDWELVLELASDESTVFVARRTGPRRFSRWVALRYVGPFADEDLDLADAIVENVEEASRVAHPCVLPIHDVGAVGSRRFVVTDYIEGGTLFDLCKAGEVSHAVLVAIAADVLAGLGAVHDAALADGTPLGLVHGRISPRNIVVGLDGRARVSDLGLVRLARTRARRGGAQAFHYQAPEVLRLGDDAVADGSVVDRRADLFSVGMVLHEVLLGRHPLVEVSTVDRAAESFRDPLPYLSSVDPTIPERLAAAIARAVAPDPALRFRSADAFSAALEAAVEPASPQAVARVAKELLGAQVEERRAACQSWVDAHARALGHQRSGSWRRVRIRAKRAVRKRGGLVLGVGFGVLAAIVAAALIEGFRRRPSPEPELAAATSAVVAPPRPQIVIAPAVSAKPSSSKANAATPPSARPNAGAAPLGEVFTLEAEPSAQSVPLHLQSPSKNETLTNPYR